MKTIKYLLSCITAAIFLSFSLTAQDNELMDYRNTTGIRDQKARTDSLKSFILQYPAGKYLGRAYSDLFNIYANKGQDSAALYYAELYLNTFPEAARMNPYNGIAYTLAQKRIGLAAAAQYAQKAVDLARKTSPRALRQVLDTQALVFFERGYPDSALVLQREAIKGNETDPSYLYYLAIYEEATGNRDDAFTHAAQALLFGDEGKALEKFEEWLKKAKPTEQEQRELKALIVKNVVETYISNKSEETLAQRKSTAAAFLAKMGVDLQHAETMAMEAISSVDDSTPLEKTITFKTNLAIIQAALGNSTKALEGLLSVRTLVSPYEGDYWFTLGQLYEKEGDPKNALENYIQGIIAFENPKIKSAAEILMKKTASDPKELPEKVARAKELLLNFDPGKSSGKNRSGKVVLAELFTGAECGPCVAADHAFDKLSEYYSRNDLAILEYHLHIPGPDPMTNPDTYKRYQFYGADFGTPTVFVDGEEKLSGGGSNYVAANRFRVYDHLVAKYHKKKSSMTIKGTAILEKDIIAVALNMNSAKASGKNPLSIHIALAEKSIAYTGANGVSRHIFAVRDLVNGAEGEPVLWKKNKARYSTSINVTEVQQNIRKYLDDPTKEPGWRGVFTGWKERTDTIDSANLAIVAWVQDNSTKEVLQSFYADVVKKTSKKK
jgi:tetratricopeptide (TPR) repeat protein